MDYATLKTTVQNYLHRDDLDSGGGQDVNVDTFIELGQARMNHDLDLMMMQTTASLVVTAATKEVTLPSDFLRVKSVRIPYSGGYRELQQASLQSSGRMLESASGASGVPTQYARYGSVLELTPVPESTTTLEIVYVQRLAKFVDPTDTDEILTTYPNIYIYAAMTEAGPFIVDDKMAGRWRAYYKEEVDRLNELSEDAEWDGPLKQIQNLGIMTP